MPTGVSTTAHARFLYPAPCANIFHSLLALRCTTVAWAVWAYIRYNCATGGQHFPGNCKANAMACMAWDGNRGNSRVMLGGNQHKCSPRQRSARRARQHHCRCCNSIRASSAVLRRPLPQRGRRARAGRHGSCRLAAQLRVLRHCRLGALLRGGRRRRRHSYKARRLRPTGARTAAAKLFPQLAGKQVPRRWRHALWPAPAGEGGQQCMPS